MMRMVGAFAEFERAMLRERTKAGLDSARPGRRYTAWMRPASCGWRSRKDPQERRTNGVDEQGIPLTQRRLGWSPPQTDSTASES